METFSNGKRKGFHRFVLFRLLESGITICLLIDAISEHMRAKQYLDSGWNYEVHPGK